MMVTGVVGIARGGFHSVLLRIDDSVWSTGVNSDYLKSSFVLVVPGGAIAMDTDKYKNLVLKDDGDVMITRKTAKGHLSLFNGSATSSRCFETCAIVVAAGGYHSMVLTEEGCVWTKGWNKNGDETTNEKVHFAQVISGGAKTVSAGDIHSVG